MKYCDGKFNQTKTERPEGGRGREVKTSAVLEC